MVEDSYLIRMNSSQVEHHVAGKGSLTHIAADGFLPSLSLASRRSRQQSTMRQKQEPHHHLHLLPQHPQRSLARQQMSMIPKGTYHVKKRKNALLICNAASFHLEFEGV